MTLKLYSIHFTFCCQGRFIPQQTSQTLHKFLSNIPTSDVGLSNQAVHAKAVILWESVVDFCRTCKTGKGFTTLRSLWTIQFIFK